MNMYLAALRQIAESTTNDDAGALREIANDALSTAPQIAPSNDIEKRARELLDLHADPIPVAVEDGRWFMVREQDALDAIAAALATQQPQGVDLEDTLSKAMDMAKCGMSAVKVVDWLIRELIYSQSQQP